MTAWVRLVEVPGGRLVHPRVEVANNFGQRLAGWMGRASIGPDDALLLLGTPAIHTFFMRLAIDLAMIDQEGRVLAVQQAIPPWRLPRPLAGARHALELPAGAAERLAIRPGLHLAWSAVEARPGER